jgi:hypothetical protein
VNLSELRKSVMDTVQETSEVLISSLDGRINSALLEVAEEHDLPSLKKVFTVSTVVSQAYCTLSSTFSGRLSYCGTSEGKVKILDGGLEELIELYPTYAEVGDIECVAYEHPVMWYQKIPAVATTLICIGYGLPTSLIKDDDTPSDLPDHLHEGLLVNRVLIDYYNKIEDGIEGTKVNTQVYQNLYQSAHLLLLNWISRRRRTISRSNWDA